MKIIQEIAFRKMKNKKDRLKDSKSNSFNISPTGIPKPKKERNIEEVLAKKFYSFTIIQNNNIFNPRQRIWELQNVRGKRKILDAIGEESRKK